MNRWILMSAIAIVALAGAAVAGEPVAFTDLDTLLEEKPLAPGTGADIISSEHIPASDLQIVVARKIDLHTHEDTIHRIYVARGSGVFRFAGQSRPVKPGDVITVPKHLVHGFDTAPGSEPLVLFVIETPD